MVIRGQQGTVRWGYQLAAGVRDWTLSRDDYGAIRLSASLTEPNPYRLAQRPLVFALPGVTGVWPILELQIEGVALSARLGPKES